MWYFSLSVIFRGSLCFRLESFLNSCLLRRHSLSNHFLLDETEDNLVYRLLTFLIFKQCFAVVKRILSTASREELMCLSVLQSTRKSCIILCTSLVCTAGLNFCDESYAFSCLGKQIDVSLVYSVAKWSFTVLMLSHVIIGLWSVKFDGSFNNEFAIEWNISLGRILHSLRGRRK